MNKNGKDFSTSTLVKKQSLLPHDVQAILKSNMNAEYVDIYLDLGQFEIEDSMIPELCEWLAKLEGKVSTLSLSENEITSRGASLLFDTLRTMHSSIKEINLYHNFSIDDKCMKSFGEYIKSNNYIKIVTLAWNIISDAGLEILAPYLEGNITFKRLFLNINKRITDKSLPTLVKIIESSHIENIYIDNSSIMRRNVIAVSLAGNNIKYGLNNLDFPDNYLNDNDLIKICGFMKKYGIAGLNELNFSENAITSKGASVLFDTLRECNSVVSQLNLSHSRVNDECMNQLGEYVQDNDHLEKISIEATRITNKGIELLSGYLITSTSLNELSLGYNRQITDDSVPYLIYVINGSRLTKVNLLHTSVSKEMKQAIEDASSKPLDQRDIPIKSNTKSAAKISSAST